MSVQRLEMERELYLVRDDDELTVRTKINKEESLSKVNKQKVFKGTKKHFTDINEKDSDNVNEKELYYKLDEENEEFLVDYASNALEPEDKQVILDGLLELLFLVSEGKIYNIDINPFNFIIREDKGNTLIKAFYRDDKGLSEINDEWLVNVKKLIGFFLVTDTSLNETNYKDLRPKHFYEKMQSDIAKQYLKIMRSSTVDQMAYDWFNPKVYKQLKGFPFMMKEEHKPRDVTSLSSVQGLEDENVDDFKEDEDSKEEQEENEEKEKKPEKRTKNKSIKDIFNENKKIILIILGVLFLIILLFSLIKNISSNDKEDVEEGDNQVEETQDGQDVEMVNEVYYQGLLESSVQKYEDASETYNSLEEDDLESLGEDEITSIYLTHLKAGEYERALKVDPEGVETLVKYMKNKNSIEEVKDIESDDPVIEYEKAVIDKDWGTVLDLKDEVREDDTRNKDIIRAYVNEDDLDGAINFVEDTDKDLKDDLRDVYESYAKDNDVKKKKRKKNVKEIKDI